MRVLVTGASGFIGEHVCRELVAAGHQVTGAVRRTGSAPNDVREMVVGDLGPATDWSSALTEQDAVIHLAARVHVMTETANDPANEFRTANVEGTLRLAQQALEAGVSRFVFMSSIKAIADESGSGPVAFDAPDNASDPYGATKREAEIGLAALGENQDMSLVVIRPVVVYGDGVGGNIRRLMGLIQRGIPVPLGSVRNRRSMIFVGNLSALVRAALEVTDVPGVPILAADADVLSTPDVMRELAAGMGVTVRLVRFPVRLLIGAAAVIRRRSDFNRLVGDLEVVRNVELLVGYTEVAGARAALQETGRSYRRPSRNSRD